MFYNYLGATMRKGSINRFYKPVFSIYLHFNHVEKLINFLSQKFYFHSKIKISESKLSCIFKTMVLLRLQLLDVDTTRKAQHIFESFGSLKHFKHIISLLPSKYFVTLNDSSCINYHIPEVIINDFKLYVEHTLLDDVHTVNNDLKHMRIFDKYVDLSPVPDKSTVLSCVYDSNHENLFHSSRDLKYSASSFLTVLFSLSCPDVDDFCGYQSFKFVIPELTIDDNHELFLFSTQRFFSEIDTNKDKKNTSKSSTKKESSSSKPKNSEVGNDPKELHKDDVGKPFLNMSSKELGSFVTKIINSILEHHSIIPSNPAYPNGSQRPELSF